jgi:hypothetical protein
MARPSPDGILWGLAIAALGLALRGWSAGTIAKDERLAVGGPYAYTRNPLYLGSLLTGLGVALSAGHWWWPALFVLWFGAVYAPTMAKESQTLAESFANEYHEYVANVPQFIPRLTPYRARASRSPETDGPSSGFTWARYRRNREWEAALGATAAFAILASKSLFG